MSSEALPVLFRDENYIAVHKPSGLLVHRTKMADGDRFALQMVRDQVGANVFPVHRLDRPTSGVLIFGLNRESARHLSLEFGARRVSKTYLAIVRGHFKERFAVLDYPLREELDAIADKNARTDKPAQDAITEFEFLDSVELPESVDR